jgi:hypothetical protein
MIPTARAIPPTQPSARQNALYPERGPSHSLYLPLGEGPRLPSTARIERAQFHRARSASKEGTWPLPIHPSEAARCASKGIVQLPHPPFFSILLRDDVAHKIVQGRISDLNLDEFPCRG